MRVAVLGMGRMGQSVAVRLLDGNHEVVVWNRTAGRAGEALKAGAAEASSPAEAAEGTEAVLVSLANDDAVLNVVLGDDGVGPHLGGAVLVDLSTVAPTTSRRLREGWRPPRWSPRRSSGTTAVRSGAATYLVAGDDKVIERLQPVFAALSEKRKHIGADVGAATTAKLSATTCSCRASPPWPRRWPPDRRSAWATICCASCSARTRPCRRPRPSGSMTCSRATTRVGSLPGSAPKTSALPANWPKRAAQPPGRRRHRGPLRRARWPRPRRRRHRSRHRAVAPLTRGTSGGDRAP